MCTIEASAGYSYGFIRNRFLAYILHAACRNVMYAPVSKFRPYQLSVNIFRVFYTAPCSTELTLRIRSRPILRLDLSSCMWAFLLSVEWNTKQMYFSGSDFWISMLPNRSSFEGWLNSLLKRLIWEVFQLFNLDLVRARNRGGFDSPYRFCFWDRPSVFSLLVRFACTVFCSSFDFDSRKVELYFFGQDSLASVSPIYWLRFCCFCTVMFWHQGCLLFLYFPYNCPTLFQAWFIYV